MREPAIAAHALCRHYGSVRAVDGLDLRVEAGTIYGLLGPNGAGKTTTLHLLLGLIPPSGGRATVLGIDPATDGSAVRARCGALLEHAGLYERLSAAENLDFAGRIAGMKEGDRHERAQELLETFELYDRRKDRIATWSKGMKQRLAIARVLFHHPEIVMLDEPTNGLDPESAVDLRHALARLARDEGVTIFLNTHNLAEAERTCDRVGVIIRGRLVADGPPQDLLNEQTTHLLVRGTFPEKALRAVRKEVGRNGLHVENGLLTIPLPRNEPVAPLVAALVGGGAAIEEVRREARGLEDAYLAVLDSLREDAA